MCLIENQQTARMERPQPVSQRSRIGLFEEREIDVLRIVAVVRLIRMQEQEPRRGRDSIVQPFHGSRFEVEAAFFIAIEAPIQSPHRIKDKRAYEGCGVVAVSTKDFSERGDIRREAGRREVANAIQHRVSPC